MKFEWSEPALTDLYRLHDFLAEKAPLAAAQIVEKLIAAVEALTLHPRKGQRVPRDSGSEHRRLIVDEYEIRYEIRVDAIYIVRLWHTREDR